MKFELYINCDNDCFNTPKGGFVGRGPIARILRNLAERVENSSLLAWNLSDIDGNKVGVAQLKGYKEEAP